MKVFLSYARKDVERIRRFVHGFDKVEADLFWDRDIQIGQDWAMRLATEIELCDALLVVWSQYSAKSEEVMKEVRAALAAGKRVVQCKIDTCYIPDILGHENVADLTQWSGVPDSDHWRAVLRTLGLKAPAHKESWHDLVLPDREQMTADGTRVENVIEARTSAEASRILKRLLRKGYLLESTNGQSIVLKRCPRGVAGFEERCRRWLVRRIAPDTIPTSEFSEMVVLEVGW